MFAEWETHRGIKVGIKKSMEAYETPQIPWKIQKSKLQILGKWSKLYILFTAMKNLPKLLLCAFLESSQFYSSLS